jgi:hypothetical protein
MHHHLPPANKSHKSRIEKKKPQNHHTKLTLVL